MRYSLLALLWLVLSTPSAFAATASSRSFDGTNDQVSWGNNVDITTNDMSCCAWINPTEDGSADTWFGKRAFSPANGYSLQQVSTDEYRCVINDGTTSQTTTGTDQDAVWTFVCCTWDSTLDDAILYQNAVNVASDTTGTLGSISNGVNLVAGEYGDGSNDANGLVAYASVFASKVLTVTEMLELMWKPEGMADSIAFVAPLMGDNPEPEWVAKLSGTVSGTDTSSTNGPPVMLGLGLPL